MKNKLVFGAGLAVGYVLGTRAGRESYEQLKSKAEELWKSPTVQDTVASTTDTIKTKAPEVQESLKDALRTSGSGSPDDGGLTGGSKLGPSGGDPLDIEEPPFQAQDDDTRPDLRKH